MTQTLRIEGYYIEHTRLRLRRVMAADGSFTRKLAHKVRLGQGASAIACTSMYLDEQEWNVLLTLPPRTLHKRPVTSSRGTAQWSLSTRWTMGRCSLKTTTESRHLARCRSGSMCCRT